MQTAPEVAQEKEQSAEGAADRKICLKSLEHVGANDDTAEEEEILELVDAEEQPAEVIPGKKAKKMEFVFGEDFVVDTMEVPNAKIIPQVIRGVALDLFPDCERYRSNDYYYAYTYTGARLTFVILKSKAYIAGKAPGVLPALLIPGRYSYRHGGQHYLIEHDDEGSVTSKVYQELPADCICLEEAAEAGEAEKFDKTLYLRWSLSNEYKPVTLVMLVVFLAVLGAYLTAVQGYKDISRKTVQVDSATTTDPVRRLPPIGSLMKAVADTTNAQGAEIKVVKKVDKATVAFGLQFQNENDTREFITRKGGRYEDGKVIFAFDLAGAEQSGAGH